MTFDYTDFNELTKLSQSVKICGHYDSSEPCEDVVEKIAFILSTTNLLEKVDCRAELVKSLVRELNSGRQFRDTASQDAMCYNARRRRNAKYYWGFIPGSVKDVTFCNIEALASDGEDETFFDPVDNKPDDLKFEQHKLEKELWVYENLQFFFREFLKAEPTVEWHEVFVKTFKATWSHRAKGARLILYKRTPQGLVRDEENVHFNAPATIIAPYKRAYDRDLQKSHFWREYLNRIRNLGGWSIPYRLRFHAALQQLKGKDAERVLNWLNYKYKVECYDDLKLFNAVFTATGTAEFLKTESSPLRDEDLAGVD